MRLHNSELKNNDVNDSKFSSRTTCNKESIDEGVWRPTKKLNRYEWGTQRMNEECYAIKRQ